MKRTAAALLALAFWSCTAASLYQPGYEPDAPNKLTISGHICTEDFLELRFPVKIAFVFDSGEISQNDPTNERVNNINAIVNAPGAGNREYAFLKWSSNTVDPTATDTFVGDTVTVNQGIIGMYGNVPCNTGGGAFGPTGCRNYTKALGRLDSLVTGDVLTTPAGLTARTKYIVVFLANGRPSPPLSLPVANGLGCGVFAPGSLDLEKCLLREKVQDLRDFVLANGAVDFIFHAVYVDNCALSPAENDIAAEEVQEMALAGAGAFLRYPIPHQCNNGMDDDGDGATDWPLDVGCFGACSFMEDGTNPMPPPGTLMNFSALDFSPASSSLIKRTLIVSNANVMAASTGIRIDSDADGLADDEEDTNGNGNPGDPMAMPPIPMGTPDPGETDPSNRDTDGDSLSDLIESLYETLGLDPLVAPLDMITMCPIRPVGCIGDPALNCDDQDLDGLPADVEEEAGTSDMTPDSDGDGLWDCEERVAGMDPTLFDSDADGVPDWLELRTGTIPIELDQNLDTDIDGVTNLDEITEHSDPLGYDRENQLAYNYRYTETNEGLIPIRFIDQPVVVRGVHIEVISPNTALGTGSLRWDSTTGELTWTEYGDSMGIPVQITGDGVYTLQSGGSCVVSGHCDCDLSRLDVDECDCNPLQACNPATESMVCGSNQGCLVSAGMCCGAGVERSITVRVTTAALPDTTTDMNPDDFIEEILVVDESLRTCIDFRVRNITLAPTLIDPLVGEAGFNSVYVYFGQVPQDRPMSFPLFSVALVRVQYLETPDGFFRDPPESEIPVTNEDFVVYEF
jgi:hypothetical protein